jgi:hypothetical protein
MIKLGSSPVAGGAGVGAGGCDAKEPVSAGETGTTAAAVGAGGEAGAAAAGGGESAAVGAAKPNSAEGESSTS